MAKEDMSTAVDAETRGLVKKGYQAPKPESASGDKLMRQLNQEAASGRDGKTRT
jgi:hypothetical protein